MAKTFDAKLDDFELVCETIEDDFEKAVVENEFPYKDGALLEDLGLKATKFRLRCYFYADTYSTYKDFVEYIKENTSFTLTHPDYGDMTGDVASLTVRHDDRNQTAEIDFTFVQELTSDIGNTYEPEVQNDTENSFLNGIQEQIDTFSSDIGSAISTASFIAQANTFITGLQATMADVANPANSLVAAIDFTTDLPSQVIGAVTQCVERYARAYDAIVDAPSQFLTSVQNSLLKLNSAVNSFSDSGWSSAASKQIQIAIGMRLGLEAAYIYKNDQTLREQNTSMENAQSFDVQGNYIAPQPTADVMTVNDLEQTLALVRTNIQNTVDVAREVQSLKDIALVLLIYVEQIKIQREKLVQVRLDNTMPLHLVCLKYNLPYAYAERLYKINAPQNPSYMSGLVSIYVR